MLNYKPTKFTLTQYSHVNCPCQPNYFLHIRNLLWGTVHQRLHSSNGSQWQEIHIDKYRCWFQEKNSKGASFAWMVLHWHSSRVEWEAAQHCICDPTAKNESHWYSVTILNATILDLQVKNVDLGFSSKSGAQALFCLKTFLLMVKCDVLWQLQAF